MIDESLEVIRNRGYALTDQELAPAIRSIAAPIRDGSGRVVAAVNVNAHAAETSVETLIEQHLPHLLETAEAISADWALWDARPIAVMDQQSSE